MDLDLVVGCLGDDLLLDEFILLLIGTVLDDLGGVGVTDAMPDYGPLRTSPLNPVLTLISQIRIAPGASEYEASS